MMMSNSSIIQYWSDESTWHPGFCFIYFIYTLLSHHFTHNFIFTITISLHISYLQLYHIIYIYVSIVLVSLKYVR